MSRWPNDMSEGLLNVQHQPEAIFYIMRTLTYFHGDAVFHCVGHCQQDRSSNGLKVPRATSVLWRKTDLVSAENLTSHKMILNGSPLLTTCEILL